MKTTNEETATSLWSLRYSIAFGMHWKHERDCSADTAALWVSEFRKAEPDVQFALSLRKPRLPKSK